MPFILALSPLARYAIAAALAVSIVGGAVWWLRHDAASDALDRNAVKETEEIRDATERAKPGPVIGADECLKRLRDGKPCI